MKCLMKYQWVKLPRNHLPEGKGIMNAWAKLASRAAFRKGQASYCGHINAVSPGMWSGGVVGLKSILGSRSRVKSLEALSKLSELGYISYSLNAKTKKLTYQITDWVIKCSGEECMDGTVYATEGYGFLCLPRNITDRLDWIFEGIITWVSSVVTDLMDAVSGMFLQALGTDMTAMEEYFPFVNKAFTVMQYTAWAILFLITVWQLFRIFGGPVTDAENPWSLIGRSALFALLIGYAKPIFSMCLDIATAPYTALMDIQMTAEDFTFAGVEAMLMNGLTSLIATISVVGLLLLVILEIALGWNYFKLLLETVERYIVVGVLCYTSPLAYSMGASKVTVPVFRSWCHMVGSQLLLLVLNVWFLRGFNSSMGAYIGNGGALSSGYGSVFLWLFCALAFLKTAQKFDSYLAAMGLNVAQTGSSMGMELLMAARVVSGIGHGARSAGNVFGGATATGTGAAASGFTSGFASRFKGNSYVRDAVVPLIIRTA